MIDTASLLRLFLAVVFGGIIGTERLLRGHAAGPHTNGLVAFGAALFVLTGSQLGTDGAARALGQVATGIGFLAGGVILRDGLSVRGLNTAATVWCTAAIGCLSGMGNLTLAACTTALVIVANSFFHYLEHTITMFKTTPEASDSSISPSKDSSPK